MDTQWSARFDALPRRYQIEREIGRGGSARVFVAADTDSGTRVAIKALHPELAHTVSALRFEREIRLLSSLEHPGILPVLDSGSGPGLLFYVMPYLGETTLAHRLVAGPLSYEEVVPIVFDLAAAIDYAHSHNVVHRDIKPANVLFRDNRAVIADFGIARAIIAASADANVSSSGMAVGTPLYMSPEQTLDPGAVDGRADTYSLGCLTYEMLAGAPPFSGATAMAMVARHAAERPPLVHHHRADVPSHAGFAIAAAMAKGPSERPETASAFARAFQGNGE